MPVLLAQLSDTHVVEDDTDEALYVDNNARAATAVAAIGNESPSVAAVLATGDLTQWGTDAEYDKLAEVLDPLDVPILPIPGNHDTRAGLRRCFPDHPWPAVRPGGDHLSWVVELEGVRIIGLDTTVPRRARWGVRSGPRGMAGAPRCRHRTRVPRCWRCITRRLSPELTGWTPPGSWVSTEFVAVIAEARVDRIICGHLHRPMSSMVAGVSAEVGMSTAVHVALNLAPDSPVQVVRDPIGYRIFRVDGSAIVGHTR